MKVVQSKLSDEIYDVLISYSKESGITISEIIRMLLITYMDNAPSINEKYITDSDVVLSDYMVHLKIPYHLYNAIKESANFHNIAISSEIRFRLHQTLTKRNIYRETELDNLYNNAIQLRRIGVNLNFFAKGINSNQVINFDESARSLFEEIKTLLKSNEKSIDLLLNNSDRQVKFEVN